MVLQVHLLQLEPRRLVRVLSTLTRSAVPLLVQDAAHVLLLEDAILRGCLGIEVLVASEFVDGWT